MIECRDKAMCLICKEVVIAKSYNLNRHCQTKHKETFEKMSPEAKAHFVEDKKIELKDISIKKYLNRSQIVSKVSFQITHMIIKHQKPFSEAPFVKDCITVAMNEILVHHKDKKNIMQDIQNLQLSRQTATRRTEIISKHIQAQLRIKIKKASSLSLCLDESTDINDVSQLVVFCRIVNNDFDVSDQMIGLVPLTNTTTALDIKAGLDQILKTLKIAYSDITAVTTDGAASMTGKKKGLVTLLKKENPNLISLQCIIHQENLVAKSGISSAKPFADTVMKIINKTISSGATRHRQFREFLVENESEAADLSKMQQVRWLSTEKTFAKLLPIVETVKKFLESHGVFFDELSDEKWIEDLCFFADLTQKLGNLNRSLQGEMNFIWKSFQLIDSFKSELDFVVEEFEAAQYECFPNLNKNFVKTGIISREKYIDWLKSLQYDLQNRFRDFQQITDLMKFGKSIENCTLETLKQVGEKFNTPFDNLRAEFHQYKSTILLNNDSDHKILSTYKTLAMALCKILSIFADSYLCESSFSKMNFIMNEYRSRLTQQHLADCLMIACSDLPVDFDFIASENESRASN